jgi:hypothetical protein
LNADFSALNDHQTKGLIMASKRNIFEEVGSDTKITKASAGAIGRAGSGDRRWVRLWLWSLVGLIVTMITVGGLTRLTDSGLSITEWDPCYGCHPAFECRGLAGRLCRLSNHR